VCEIWRLILTSVIFNCHTLLRVKQFLKLVNLWWSYETWWLTILWM